MQRIHIERDSTKTYCGRRTVDMHYSTPPYLRDDATCRACITAADADERKNGAFA